MFKVLRSVGVVVLLLAVGGADSAVAKPAGPETAKCGKFKQGSKARFKACKRQNAANRVVFNQIKDSKFVGVRGDGEGVEETFCASGKFESRSSGSYGTGVSTGNRWTVADAVVKRGGKSIVAFVKGSEGFEVALVRKGSQWQIGIASLGRVLDPGDVTRSAAAAECAAL